MKPTKHHHQKQLMLNFFKFFAIHHPDYIESHKPNIFFCLITVGVKQNLEKNQKGH